jgi:hypothetical protein
LGLCTGRPFLVNIQPPVFREQPAATHQLARNITGVAERRMDIGKIDPSAMVISVSGAPRQMETARFRLAKSNFKAHYRTPPAALCR